MSRTIELQHQYNYPPEAIWSCLTATGQLAGWLMDNDFKTVVGHSFQVCDKAESQVWF